MPQTMTIEMIHPEETVAKMREHPRRLQRYAFTPEMLMTVISGDFVIEKGAAPAGSVKCGAYYDGDRDWFEVLVWNESFASVPLGEIVPLAESPIIRSSQNTFGGSFSGPSTAGPDRGQP